LENPYSKTSKTVMKSNIIRASDRYLIETSENFVAIPVTCELITLITWLMNAVFDCNKIPRAAQRFTRHVCVTDVQSDQEAKAETGW
jgi:hypothetical protein